MGNTTDSFRYRWNNYKMEGGKAHENNMKKVRQSFLLSHVLQDYCKDFLEDAKVRLIHKNNVLTPLSENIAG